ncbi:MAG TPA: orotate phosphoribosyltransferase [Fimbriimonadaceae bacterium]|nr:orotate phosphoribosyltransferase [Fimbriimonadaceae bacterium]
MPVDLGKLLEESGAILKGHFLLASGRHSDVYFEKFRILEQPHVLSALCAEVAVHFADAGIELVAGPTTGGIIIAFEVGRQMGLPTRYAETVDGVKKLRRNAYVAPGTRVLIVDDVLTTGMSVLEAAEAVKAHGAVIAGIAVLIDRSVDFDPGVPFFAAYRVEAETYAPQEVPEWLARIPATKPGTRASA